MSSHRSEGLAVALCGAGDRGLDVYGPQLAQAGARIVAVAEPRERRRGAAERRFGCAVFRDWREMVDFPAEAVVVATQDAEHVEPALAFLARGRPVLLEKPMACRLEDCARLCEAAAGRVLTVAHVLRYTAYFRKMKEVVDSGVLGQVATVRHLESVNYWHMAHSYVRGNWGRTADSSPMIVAKSCHDMDILHYLLGRRCLRLASFGRLSHFQPSSAPPGAASRCLDCPVASTCPYDAARFYLGRLGPGWPVSVLTEDCTREGVLEALRTGPYGRCVYACGSDAVDHQVVAMEFEGGLTATFTMTAFTEGRGRETEVLGSHGQLRGDEKVLELTRFDTGEVARWDFTAEWESGGHAGGDRGLVEAFLDAVAGRAPSDPWEAFESHRMAFAAERARVEGGVVDL